MSIEIVKNGEILELRSSEYSAVVHSRYQGHEPREIMMRHIFDELQVDGVAVIERTEPKLKLRSHIQSDDYVEGVSGWRIDLADGSIKLFKKNVEVSANDKAASFHVRDPLEHQDTVAADSVAEAQERTRTIEYPFIVEAGKLKINGVEVGDLDGQIYISEAAIGDAAISTRMQGVEPIEARIGEALAPQQVTNICSQTNDYGNGLTEKQVRKIARKAVKKGISTWLQSK